MLLCGHIRSLIKTLEERCPAELEDLDPCKELFRVQLGDGGMPTYCSLGDQDQERALSPLSKTETLLRSALYRLKEEKRLLSLVQKRAHNYKLPIHRLPPELLSIIFTFAYGGRNPERFFVPMNYPAISVCYLWRYWALSTPTLWNVLCISRLHQFQGNIEHSALLAQRSGLKLPLALHLHIGYGSLHENLIVLSEALASFLPRVESLFLQIYQLQTADVQDHFPLPIDLPSLRELRISLGDDDTPVHPVDRLFEYPTTALETVLATWDTMPSFDMFSAEAFSSLSSIRQLNLVRSGMNSTKVFHVLASLPELEVLAWESQQEDIEHHHTLSALVPISNLKIAWLEGGGHGDFLSSIHAPRLEALYLARGWWRPRGISTLGASLIDKRKFPALQSLSVDGVLHSAVSLSHVLSLALLRELRLRITDEVECAMFFQAIRAARSLQTLSLLLDEDMDPEVFASHLAGFMEYRRTCPDDQNLHRMSIHFMHLPRDEIPSLTSLCDSSRDDLLNFTFSNSSDPIPTFKKWWSSNTPKTNL